MFVFVQNKEGEPLMPTKRCGRVKWLLRKKQARIVCAEPFTIRLLYDSDNYVQELYAGIDTGSKYVGISVSTKNDEVFSGTVELRTDISKLLDDRRQLRSNRRGRLRSRKKKDKRGQWDLKNGEQYFGPAAHNKIESHIRIMKFLCKLLPLKQKLVSCVLEIGKFDIALLKDSTLSSTDYQNGDCKGYENKKAFIRHRDGYECQHCHGKSGDKKLEVHHIKWKKKMNGTDDVNNLITLCSICHADVHAGRIQLEVKQDLKKKSALYLKNAAAMNTMRYEIFKRFKKAFPNWNMYKTTGFVTSQNRREHGIEKSHANDAYLIAGNFNARKSDANYTGKLFRSHNRKLHKENNAKITETNKNSRKKNQGLHLIKGFIKYDRVLYNGILGVITSTMSSGSAIVKSLATGNKLHEKSVVPMHKLAFVEHGHTIMFELNRKR